jgi:serine/threonine-protein kinase
MGVVVAARHEQLGFAVALKFMLPAALNDPSMKERFLREARAAGSLRSEHVARVTDFGTLDNGAPYIVMEFLQGNDLQEVVTRSGVLPPHEAVQYVMQACKGMEEAHALGIVHRDLKPQNLFLTHRPDGTPLVKVLDFGISKLGGQEHSLSVTSTSAMMGSPLYMAPEQMRSSKNVDARADIYSLGVILYQLVTGQVPNPADTLGELFERVFTRPTPPPRLHRPELAPELEDVIMRCLAKTPEGRFQNVGQLVSALAPFAADPSASLLGTHRASSGPVLSAEASSQGSSLGRTTGAVSSATPELPGVRRRRTMLGITAAAIALVGASFVVMFLGKGTSTVSPRATVAANSAVTASPMPSALGWPAVSLPPSPLETPSAAAALATGAPSSPSASSSSVPRPAGAPPGVARPRPAAAATPAAASGGKATPAAAPQGSVDVFNRPD